jgi:hypothetical protein
MAALALHDQLQKPQNALAKAATAAACIPYTVCAAVKSSCNRVKLQHLEKSYNTQGIRFAASWPPAVVAYRHCAESPHVSLQC